MGLFDSLFRKKSGQLALPPVSSSRLAELAAKFPFPLRAVRGDQAEAELLRLRRELQGAGLCPVIVGEFDSAVRLLDVWEDPFDFDQQLALSGSTSVDAWLAARVDEDPELYDVEETGEVDDASEAPMMRLQAGYNHRGLPHSEVFIATLPTADSTTIPLHLRFGDWNDCPPPFAHTLMARHWQEKFGAELATVASDVVEFTVARPPADDAIALELAKQQYLYCNDIVDQGVGSVATLAAALRFSTRWYFWWD